jgi:hypothetical protein
MFDISDNGLDGRSSITGRGHAIFAFDTVSRTVVVSNPVRSCPSRAVERQEADSSSL